MDWKIHDFRKNSGDNEAILDFRDLSKVQVKNDNVQAFNTNWDEVLSADSDRLTDRTLESLYKMQVEKSEDMKYLLQVDKCILKLMAPRRLEQNIKDSNFKATNRDQDNPANGAPSKGTAKGKGKEKAKYHSERGGCGCKRWMTKCQ